MIAPRRLAISALVVVLAVAGARLGCRAVARSETERILAEVRAAIERAAAGLPEDARLRLRAGLDEAAGLAAEGRLSPIARDSLRRRTEAVLADGALHPREAEHLLRLLADLAAWRDEVHALKYMGQR